MSDIAKMIAIAKKFGGGSSAPAPVVILPETELTGEGVQYTLPKPPENVPISGSNYKIVWDGVEYFSPALDVTGTIGEGTPMFAFGNSAVAFGEGGAAQIGNPAPGAPYFLALVPNGKEVTEGGPITYGMIMATEEPTAPVLSIVQTEGASEDSGSSGSTEVYTVTATGSTTGGLQVSDVSKSFEEILTAAKAGYIVRLVLAVNGGYIILPLTVYTDTTVVFFGYPTAGMSYQVMGTADGFTGDLGT